MHSLSKTPVTTAVDTKILFFAQSTLAAKLAKLNPRQHYPLYSNMCMQVHVVINDIYDVLPYYQFM